MPLPASDQFNVTFKKMNNEHLFVHLWTMKKVWIHLIQGMVVAEEKDQVVDVRVINLMIKVVVGA